MSPRTETIRRILTPILMLLIGMLVLQSLGYGVGFSIHPDGGVNEFATAPANPADPLSVGLIGMLGVGMLGVAALLVVAAVLIRRENPAGVHIAMIIGGTYVLAGLSAHRAGWGWDAWFYGITGALLVGLSAAVRRVPDR